MTVKFSLILPSSSFVFLRTPSSPRRRTGMGAGKKNPAINLVPLVETELFCGMNRSNVLERTRRLMHGPGRC